LVPREQDRADPGNTYGRDSSVSASSLHESIRDTQQHRAANSSLGRSSG
jgi:hypothetical protein